MEDRHQVLTNCFLDSTLNQKKVNLITYPNMALGKQIKKLKYLDVFSQNFSCFIKILKSTSDFYIQREFSNLALLMLFPLVFFKRKKILFNINHNMKNIEKKIPLSIYTLCLLGFRFIFLDGYLLKPFLPKSILKNFIFVPFRLQNYDCKKNKFIDKKAINVGIVGDFREEKFDLDQFQLIKDGLSKIENINLYIGLRNNPDLVIEKLKLENLFVLKMTDSFQEYSDFLNELDVLIILAKKDTYFSRHSGTIMDSIQHKTIPVVPDFPVFKSQITFPHKVGVFYKSSNEFEFLIKDIIEKREELVKNINKYVSYREKTLNINY